MLYVIEGKPYIKVSNYYRQVQVSKKGDEYYLVPLKGEENRIEITRTQNNIQITQLSVEDYYKKNNIKSKLETYNLK